MSSMESWDKDGKRVGRGIRRLGYLTYRIEILAPGKVDTQGSKQQRKPRKYIRGHTPENYGGSAEQGRARASCLQRVPMNIMKEGSG